MGIRDKFNAMAELPKQINTMGVLMVLIGLMSVVALGLAIAAVRHAN
jgi:hypothetical protein